MKYESVFRRRWNETILPSDLTLAGSEFHTVGAATHRFLPDISVCSVVSWICASDVTSCCLQLV